jgi:mRNA-degrading endonuclease RelE of RelBE toxin-antitoxin system
MLHLELARRAPSDLQRLRGKERKGVRRALERLAAEAENLDVKILVGHAPWKRLRAGDYRVIFRELTRGESDRVAGGRRGLLIDRIVNRAQLDRAVERL